MKIVILLFLLVFLFSGCVAVPVTPEPEVEVEADIPEVAVAPEPELVAMEDNVYFIPGIGADIFFYGGWWWRPYGGYWYRSHIHNGCWVIWGVPPPVIVGIPLLEYRHKYQGRPHVPYGEFRSRHTDYRPEMHRPPKHWNSKVEQGRQQQRDYINKIEKKQISQKKAPPVQTATLSQVRKQYPQEGQDKIKSQVKKQYPQEGQDKVQKVYKSLTKADEHDFQKKGTVQKSPTIQKTPTTQQKSGPAPQYKKK